MIVQRWGCDKCKFAYGSHVRLAELKHHCPPKSHNVVKAKLIEGLPPRDQPAKPKAKAIKKVEPPQPTGRVLKRRRSVVQ